MIESTEIFIKKFVDKRSKSIENRKEALNWTFATKPIYLFLKAENIRLMYLLGMDTELMKIVPIFIEDLLINLIVAVKANFYEEIPKLLKSYEQALGRDNLEKLYKMKFLKAEEYNFCNKYLSKTGIRNKEIHNRELDKFSNTELLMVDEKGNPWPGISENEKKELKEFFKASPTFHRLLNRNNTIENIKPEVINTILLYNKTAGVLERIESLPNKKTYELYDQSTKGIYWVITCLVYNNVEEAKRYVDSFRLIIKNDFLETKQGVAFKICFCREFTQGEVTLFFLDIFQGQHKVEKTEEF